MYCASEDKTYCDCCACKNTECKCVKSCKCKFEFSCEGEQKIRKIMLIINSFSMYFNDHKDIVNNKRFLYIYGCMKTFDQENNGLTFVYRKK